MDDSSRRVIVEILERCHDQIVDSATDWVRELSIDLGSARPREETRRLVERVVATQTTLLLEGDPVPLEEFIEFVSSFRASSEFHVSTLLRGLLSFRAGLEGVLRREIADGWMALDLLTAVDRVAQSAVLRAADVYTEKLNHTILRRREELERELNALSSPVLQVWEGILVVPLIGEIDSRRAEHVRERVLNTVVTTRSRVVLVDITGLSVTDENLAAQLLGIVGCVRLLGADAMLVGVSPDGAIALAKLDVKLDQIRSFSTLHDGLRAAISRIART